VDLGLYDITYNVEDVHWWFAGRRAIVFEELQRILERRTGNGHAAARAGHDVQLNHHDADSRILDLGCGTGRNLVELERVGEPIGLDLESRALDYCRQRGRRMLVQSSAERLPFRSESFDIVTALDLLEHIDDDLAGAREVWRVLRPGGHFLLFVPAYRWLWGPQDDISHHRRRYSAPQLRSVIQRAGFRVRRLTHANLFLLPFILAGRRLLRMTGAQVSSENNLHPAWTNGALRSIFMAERHLLRRADLPLGVSLMCVASKDGDRMVTGGARVSTFPGV
jgi:ubiquinone/menaquinone biosynthesis C-methylase UbiE